jgi:hypothetical protein
MNQQELNEKLEELRQLQGGDKEHTAEEKLIYVLENTVTLANRHYEDMKLLAHQAMAALTGMTGQYTELPSEPDKSNPESEEFDPGIDGGELSG